MLEHQFIQFGAMPEIPTCDMPLPVGDGMQTTFFIQGGISPQIDIITPDGILIKSDAAQIARLNDKGADSIYQLATLQDLSTVRPGACFRLRYTHQGEIVYSNLLQRVQPHKYAEVRYSCDEDAFGFPFSPLLADGTHPYLQLMLPIVLRKPQLKQSDKVYETLTGKRIVIYATINKEYEAQTEYIHEDWHEKNVIALCCDHISIDGESLVRSESYEVNWDEYTETECGTKLAMATFKMQANINQRNSNHG